VGRVRYAWDTYEPFKSHASLRLLLLDEEVFVIKFEANGSGEILRNERGR